MKQIVALVITVVSIGRSVGHAVVGVVVVWLELAALGKLFGPGASFLEGGEGAFGAVGLHVLHKLLHVNAFLPYYAHDILLQLLAMQLLLELFYLVQSN